MSRATQGSKSKKLTSLKMRGKIRLFMKEATRDRIKDFHTAIRGLAVIAALVFVGEASAGQYFYNDPSDVDWASLTSVNQANIDSCFRGNVACNATTDGKWRSYPQRTNGDPTGELYNGCYQYRGRDLVRYANLNSAGNCPCPNGQNTCTGESLVRVFLGYQTFCPGGAPSCTAGGEVRVNCLIETFSMGSGATQIGSYIQNCSDTRPIRLSRSIAITQASPTPGCAAGTYLVGGVCTPCAAGTFKEFAGNFACSTCPAAAIANGTGISYATTPSAGATSPTACRVSYGCAAGYGVGTNPAAYSTSNGYVGANCALNASPTPSPSPVPTCNPATDVANSSRYLSCTYSCGSSQVIYSGQCGDAGPLNKVRTQQAGCSTAVPTACSFVTPQSNTCAAVTCPAGKFPYRVWDVSAMATFQTLVPGTPGGVCAMPGGETPYYICSPHNVPPDQSHSSEFGACTSVNGWTYSGTKSYTMPPWNGNGYCTW